MGFVQSTILISRWSVMETPQVVVEFSGDHQYGGLHERLKKKPWNFCENLIFPLS